MLPTNLQKGISFEDKDGLLQDWEVFARLGKYLGYKKSFDFKSSQKVFEEYQEMTKLSKDGHLDIYKADYVALETSPFVWGDKLFSKNIFATPNQKANLFFVENKNLSEQTSKMYPFTLLTGRTRDQWHSGSKTTQIDTLLKHKTFEFVEIHPKDAKTLNINEGESVKISSLRGELIASVIFADINRDTIFIPISHRDVNYLTDDKLDPLSKEPDYNHSAVKIEKID